MDAKRALLFQGLIVFAVMATDIQWRWSSEPIIPASIGIVLAWLLTRLLNWVAAKLPGSSSGDQTGAP
jgi:hypothetical protein